MLIRLTEKLAHLIQEALLVLEQTPRFDAQNEVEAPFAAQNLSQISLLVAWLLEAMTAEAACELSTHAIVAHSHARRELARQELQVVGLSMADIKHAKVFQGVKSSCLQCGIVVQLKLEDVGSAAQLAEHALGLHDALGAQQSVP